MDNEAAWRNLKDGSPAPIFFDPTDVARVIAFLCTDAARGSTHSDLRIPGSIYTRLRMSP